MPDHEALDGHAARYYRPPYAVMCWVDDGHVHIEIPSKDAKLPPYIQRWPLTEGGLSKALAVMKQGYKEYSKTGKVLTPIGRQAVRPGRTVNASEAQREQARAILKRLGII